ncbi:MAG: pseudouridine synthase [Christensenellales bacterium]
MPVTETIKITNSSRLDVALSERTGKTRSAIKQLIEKGNVLVNGNPPKKSGEAVKAATKSRSPFPTPSKNRKKDIPIDILYEDADVAVINKPQGLTVHPAGGNRTDTLVNALMFRLDSLSGINGEIRPGIVHRLDKDTSGVMIVAKNDEAHLSLSRQIADRTVVKEYVAILEGNLTPDEGE